MENDEKFQSWIISGRYEYSRGRRNDYSWWLAKTADENSKSVNGLGFEQQNCGCARLYNFSDCIWFVG